MPDYTQTERPLSITTPLGKDVLLVTALRGHEAISQLFGFQLDLIADRKNDVPFDRLVGQGVTVEMQLRDGSTRYFNGLVKRFSQGARDDTFVGYRTEVVPKLWLLTKKVRSRIFQHLTIPDILQQVFVGLDVVYDLSATYFPRDFCVQYRESDFAFASRLMEEEGIYYFFKHANGTHQMVVTDVPSKHPTVPGPASAIYDEIANNNEDREDMRVTAWEKSQEFRSGECTLWDHCFELPGNPLEASEKTVDSVTVGKAVHKLKVGGNDQCEIYDYPGGYAQRFDGINRAGGERPEDIQRIFADRTRTVRIRMEQEEAMALDIEGESDCGHFTAGHEFTLTRHFDANDKYLLTGIEHKAEQGDYRTGQSDAFTYQNRFTCIPSSLKYRPQRLTPKPILAGIQTATVVGPPGEEVFVDKYGRVKVQFHWDREGKKDSQSSCWLRVAQIWAGNRWGAFFWPRIGHEVVVGFEEGDPDQPLVTGSVYNAANMPPLGLPATKMYGGIKSASLEGRSNENYNSLVFVDKKGQEHLAIHSERHLVLYAEYDIASRFGRHHSGRVSGVQMVTVGSLPGMGGSGGDPTLGTIPSNPKTSGAAFGKPHPQAILGLNASTVYGSAFTASAPLSFQLACGGLSKLIVDMFGFLEAFPGVVGPGDIASFPTGMLGSTQVVLGTSANVVMGQAYNIILGPPPIDLHTLDKTAFQPVAFVIGKIMLAMALIYMLAFAAIPGDATSQKGVQKDWDSNRFILLLIYQVAVEVCTAVLIGVANKHNNAGERPNQSVHDSAFVVQGAAKRAAASAPWGTILGAEVVAGVTAVILPAVLEALGEKNLTESVDDSS